MIAIDLACIARGEMQWTQGYRTARSKGVGAYDDAEDRRLYGKMMDQCQLSGERESHAYNLITRLIRTVRRDERKDTRKARKHGRR